MYSYPKTDSICATSRVLPFTRDKVFAAFAQADSLATWWGPDGFKNTFEVFEFKAQGRWKFVMHGPDGTDYPNECVFQEVSPAKVVIRHTCEPLFTLTVTLANDNSSTLLGWSQAFDDPALAASIWHIIEPANEQNLNRLHAVLAATL
jgi:Activator of Hsp90 ATPase homolog 1-like protein